MSQTPKTKAKATAKAKPRKPVTKATAVPAKAKSKRGRAAVKHPLSGISQKVNNPIEWLGSEAEKEITAAFDAAEKALLKKKSREAGRLCKLTRARFDAIMEAVVLGMPQEDLVNLVNISVDTMLNWKAQGKVDKDKGIISIFSVFLEGIKRAEAMAIKNSLEIVKTAGQASWQAAAWYLERKRPKDFGRTDKVEHSTPVEKPMEHKVTSVTVGLNRADLPQETIDAAISKFIDVTVKARELEENEG